jgi:hypothetical protein
MKRDLDLIRKILLAIEQKDSLQPQEITIDDYDPDNVAYHILLLDEAGFVKSYITEGAAGGIEAALVGRLTWAGHEFLEMARNDTIWEKAKKFLKEKSVSIPFVLLIELLKSLVKDALEIK